MLIDDRANGSGWCLGKNEWRDGRINRVLSVLNEWVMDVNMNVGEW